MRKSLLVVALSITFLMTIGAVLAVPWHGLTLYERWSELHTGAVYYSGHTRAHVLALTFDDGPDPRYTPQVLAILRKHHIHATFFVVGQRLALHPDLVRQAVADGNVIGNHTETHGHIERDQNPLANAELERCETQIEQVTGERTYLFRPPRGWWNPTVFGDARHQGYRTILWSLAFDRSAIRNSDLLRRRVVHLARPGDILLMHDGSALHGDERGPTVRELDGVITGLERRGFRFVTIPQLLHIAGDAPAYTGVSCAPHARPALRGAV